MPIIINGTGTISGVSSNGRSAAQTGSVIQVVNAVTTTQATTTSTSYSDTGLTATITPKFSTSKILILVSQNGCFSDTPTSGVALALLRGTSSNICQFSKLEGYVAGATSGALFSSSACYLDSPATTSATTYKTQFAVGQTSGTVRVQNNSDYSTITLLEIAG